MKIISYEAAVDLARIYYPVHTLGPGERVGIWLAGCDRNCPQCISPELQSRDSGRQVAVREIMEHVKKLCGNADGFTISGGEPFYVPSELRGLVEAVSEVTDDIIIFTGYTLEELKALQDDDVDYILDNIGVLVDGPFIPEMICDNGLRGSSNQNIHIFNNTDRYNTLNDCERSIQVVVSGDRVITIGIPSVNDND